MITLEAVSAATADVMGGEWYAKEAVDAYIAELNSEIAKLKDSVRYYREENLALKEDLSGMEM